MKRYTILLFALLFITFSCYKDETGEKVSLDGLLFNNIENSIIELKCSFNQSYQNELINQGYNTNEIGGSPTFTNDRFDRENESMIFYNPNKYLIFEDTKVFKTSKITINIWIFASIDLDGNWLLHNYPNYSLRQNFFSTWSTNPVSMWGVFLNSNIIPRNQWIMITSTVENNNFKFYINGVLKGNNTINGYNFLCDNTLNNEIEVGVISFGYVKMDDLTIYNRALSDVEIQKLYNN